MRQNPQANIESYFFAYSIQFLATASAGSASKTCNIQADSNFLLQQLIFGCFTNASQTRHSFPYLTLQLTDLSSGMNLFDQPQLIGTVAGTAEMPFLLPTPRIFPANSTIQASIVNTQGAIVDTFITLSGQKVRGLSR